jgi:hypothetical protein
MKAENLINKNMDRLIEQYGESEFGLFSKVTGELQDIPYGTNFNLPLDKKQIKYIKSKEQKFKAKELFVKVYKNPIEILGGELSNRDFAWFMRLIPYISQSECILIDKDEKYLNVRQISALLGVNYDNAKSVFRNFEALNLIGKVKRRSQKDLYKSIKVIVVNPYIFFNGKDLEKDIYELFKNSRWATINNDSSSNKNKEE